MHPFFDGSRRALLASGGAWIFVTMLGAPSIFALGAFAQSAKRPIGIIGSGNVGGGVGALWVKSGHPVMFSSRDPSELKDMVASLGPLAHAGTVAQAIAFGEVIFIAVPYAALPGLGKDYGAALGGKIVLDACNAIPSRDGDAISKEVDDNGIGVTSQKYLPGTRLVRAFSTVGPPAFAGQANRPDPKYPVPIAGDDPGAVQVAEELVRDAGFEPVMVGSLADARKFQQRVGIAHGRADTAAELKKALGVAP